MPKFSVITVATHETPNYFTLRKSAERLGWPFAAKFVEPTNHNDFLRKKHIVIKDFLLELGPSVSTFLYVDAFDTVFIRENPRDLGEMVGLCFGGEMNCYPQVGYAPLFERPGLGPFPFLNSGMIWGRSEAYITKCPDYLCHDQLAWTRAAVEDPYIGIDTWGTTGFNLHSTDPDGWEKVNGVWLYKPTMQSPYVLHGNGMWPIPSWAMRGE